MAILNKEEGCVVVRIVYAGAPMSGKTESLRSLSALLFGAVRGEEEFYSPDDTSGRTLYFDWLNYTGGYFKGYKINCQLISVPGQKTLKDRRKLLLEMADVVVFVLDSQVDKLDTALDYYREMLPWLEREGEPPVGVVIQANKRDMEDAAQLPHIQQVFDDNPNLLILGTVATTSSGVREAFVSGVKVGLERASWLLENNKMEIGSSKLGSGHALLNLMHEREAAHRMTMEQSHDENEAMEQRIRQVPDLDLSATQLHRFISDAHLERAASLVKPEEKIADVNEEEPALATEPLPSLSTETPESESGNVGYAVRTVSVINGTHSAPYAAQDDATVVASDSLHENIAETSKSESSELTPAAAMTQDNAGQKADFATGTLQDKAADGSEDEGGKAIVTQGLGAGESISSPRSIQPEAPPPSLPHKDLVIAGCVFPPVSGRIILHRISDESAVVEQAASGDWEARIGDHWRLLSRTTDCFNSANEARMYLVSYANLHKELGAVLSEHRCMAIVEPIDQNNEWRVWQIVRRETSLSELLDDALVDITPQRIAKKVLLLAEKFLAADQAFAAGKIAFPLTMESIALSRNQPVFTDFIPNNSATDESSLPVMEQLKQSFKPSISKALHENSTLALRVPYILHHLDAYAKADEENKGMIEVLRTLFIGDH